MRVSSSVRENDHYLRFISWCSLVQLGIGLMIEDYSRLSYIRGSPHWGYEIQPSRMEHHNAANYSISERAKRLERTESYSRRLFSDLFRFFRQISSNFQDLQCFPE